MKLYHCAVCGKLFRAGSRITVIAGGKLVHDFCPSRVDQTNDYATAKEPCEIVLDERQEPFPWLVRVAKTAASNQGYIIEQFARMTGAQAYCRRERITVIGIVGKVQQDREPIGLQKRERKPCKEAGCHALADSCGYCIKHYTARRRAAHE